MMTRTPLRRLASRLFNDRAEEIKFLEAIQMGGSRSDAILHQQETECTQRPAWAPPWVSLGERPSRYDYSLDLSDIWRLAPIFSLPQPRRILDLCAAPGGSTLIASSFFPKAKLFANDVVSGRAHALAENINRCQSKEGVTVWNASLDELERKVSGGFDLVIVDPPCSEQARMAEDSEEGSCFDTISIKGNATRQMDILDQALKLVAPGGHLLYTTATFSIGENEYVIDKVFDNHPDFKPVELGSIYKSALTERPCYRLYPQSGFGFGGFTSLHQKEGDAKPLPEIPRSLKRIKAEGL